MGAFRPTEADVWGGLPRRHYRLIMADPNWTYEAYSSKGDGQRSASAHYDVSTVEEIGGLPVADLAHPEGCHLFLWATWPNLAQAFAVAEAWGWRYSGSGFVWVKASRGWTGRLLDVTADLHWGLGHTTRKNSEPCLLFRRGEPRRLRKDIHEVIVSPLTRHSEKPVEAYRRAAAYAAGPYLELYSRRTPPGWDAWGLEAGRFDDGQIAAPARVLSPDALPLFRRGAA